MDYIKEAMRTHNDTYYNIKQQLEKEDTIDMLHSFMGLSTEANELLTNLKKHIFYNAEIDIENVYEELGNCLWFIALACNTLDISFDDLMDMNIKKLKKRYPKKFGNKEALMRKIEEEKKVFEEKKKLDDLKGKVKKYGHSIESLV